MAITVVSTDPINNETDVSIQKRLSVTFSTAVNRTTVTSYSIVLYETNNTAPIEGKITFSADNTVVYFLPTRELDPSFSYTFVILGEADNLAGAIENSVGDVLATTTTVNFRTGIERFVSLEEVTDRTDIEHIAPIREEETLAEVTGVLSLVETDPVGFSTNITGPDTITATFDNPLSTSSFNEAWLTIEMTPIIDYEDYFYGDLVDGVRTLKIEDDSLTFALPSGSLSISGNDLIWTKTSGEWPYNALVTVTLSEDIEDTSGNTLGADVTFVFTTLLFPMYTGVNVIRAELGSVIANISDDTINRIILEKSIESWELAGKTFALASPPFTARQYAKCATIVSIYGALSVAADLNRGASKKLGDFEVRYEGVGGSLNSPKYKSALNCMELNEAKLRRFAPSLRMRISVVGAESPTGQLVFQGIRNWDSFIYGCPKIPVANWCDQRKLKHLIESGVTPTIYFGRLNPLEAPNYFLSGGT